MNRITTLTVIGSGLMGSGIAQISASNGFKVNLCDVEQDNLDKSLNSMKKNLERVAKKKYNNDAEVKKYVNESLANVKTSTDYNSAVKESDLVIEAIVENLSAKTKLFRDLDAIAPSPCIFASNTSSLSVKSIADSVERKDRFLGLHFFNPVPIMKLLEIIKTDETSESTLNSAKVFGEAVKKSIVTCKDTPGFVVNRLLVPYILEAFRMHEREVSSFQEIDSTMKLGAGHPMGPFELADYIGLDTIKFIVDGWHTQFPNEPNFAGCESLNKLVSEKKFGKKNGQGFYTYDSMGNKVQ